MQSRFFVFGLCMLLAFANTGLFAANEKIWQYSEMTKMAQNSDKETIGLLGFCFDGYPDLKSAKAARNFFSEYFKKQKAHIKNERLFITAGKHYGFALDLEENARDLVKDIQFDYYYSYSTINKLAGIYYSAYEKNGGNILLMEYVKRPTPAKNPVFSFRFFVTPDSYAKIPDISVFSMFSPKHGFSQKTAKEAYDRLLQYASKSRLDLKILSVLPFDTGKTREKYEPVFESCYQIDIHYAGAKKDWPLHLNIYCNECYSSMNTAKKVLNKMIREIEQKNGSVIYSGLHKNTVTAYKNIPASPNDSGEKYEAYLPVIITDQKVYSTGWRCEALGIVR